MGAWELSYSGGQVRQGAKGHLMEGCGNRAVTALSTYLTQALFSEWEGARVNVNVAEMCQEKVSV